MNAMYWKYSMSVMKWIKRKQYNEYNVMAVSTIKLSISITMQKMNGNKCNVIIELGYMKCNKCNLMNKCY